MSRLNPYGSLITLLEPRWSHFANQPNARGPCADRSAF